MWLLRRVRGDNDELVRERHSWIESIASAQLQDNQAQVEELIREAVKRGIWLHPLQRPLQLVRGLAAQPWHDPAKVGACMVLRGSYEAIREEALGLLRGDSASGEAGTSDPFLPYQSAALRAGEWADVGLFYNARRNDANLRLAPRTMELLSSESLRRAHCSVRNCTRRFWTPLGCSHGRTAPHAGDCTSFPLGSAYFSLLRPRTRLAAHCGPTNCRLRAHLALLVPEGDCAICVGGEARRWREGEVLLFDDSFEHSAWNDTDLPRLVLIVDLWHFGLRRHSEREAVLQAELRQRYRGVVDEARYESTTERGH